MQAAIRRFLTERGGNFAMMTAVLAVPLLMGAGLAIDTSNVVRTRAALQNALDAAVLAVAREGKDLPDDKAREIAQQFLAGNFDLDVTKLTFMRDGTAVTIAAELKLPLYFGGILGYGNWAINGRSTADLAYTSYEIALALDTTGSMAGGKIAALKSAVNDLIDNMARQVNDKDRLKFALVPFSSFVNVGPGFGPSFDKSGKQIAGTGASWLDLDGRSPEPQFEFPRGLSRFQVLNNIGAGWSGCVETRIGAGGKDFGTSDAAADPASPDTLFVPSFAIDEEDRGGYQNSYIGSSARTTDMSVFGMASKLLKYGVPLTADGSLVPYGETAASSPVGLTRWKPVSFSASGDRGPGYGCYAQPIVPLSNDYEMLKRKVGKLAAKGNTNIMEGVAWGMRVLSPAPPFTEGVDPEKVSVQKMLVVLTDGSNVFGNNSTELGSTYSSFGYLADGRLGTTTGNANATNALMNARTLAACDAAKAQGMEVYTIRLEEPNVTTGYMLRDCASGADHFIDVPSRSQLDEAFSKIREKMVRVRLSS